MPGRNYFTDEQMEELKKSPYVRKISKANMVFTEEFKAEFMRLYNLGTGPAEIIRQLGINPKILGKRRIYDLTARIKAQSKRPEGFSRKPSGSKGRSRKGKHPKFDNDTQKATYYKEYAERLEQEIELLKNRGSGGSGQSLQSKKFQIIYDLSLKKRNKLNISEICKIAGVSRSGFYAFVKAKPKREEKDIRDALDFTFIKATYDYKSWKKGARQIRYRLKKDFGIVMNLKKIRRLMKKYGLICPIRKANPIKKMIKAQQSDRAYENIVDRNFLQGRAKLVLLTDITYLEYGHGKRAYLSSIKDAITKMILAHQVSLHLDLSFVIRTVEFLIENYKAELDGNVLIHSDQGCHYTSISYQNLLKDNHIIQSMSRKGNCWDNTPQESFHAIHKTEMDLNNYSNYEKMALGIAEYISYYNYDRGQEGLNWMTPYEYDQYLSDRFMNPLKYLPYVIYA